LLLRKALVHGDQDIELARHGVEEIAVIEIAPAHLGGRADLMTGEAVAKPPRDTGVEENPHRDGGALLSGDGLGEQCGLCQLQHGHGMLARHAREVAEEGF
jgi:hypothetical protein